MKYRRHRRSRNTLTGFTSVCGVTEEVPDYIKLWVLRILMKLGGHRGFLQGNYFCEDRIAQVIGLGRWVDSKLDFNLKKIMKDLHSIYMEAENELEPLVTDQVLISNVRKIAEVAGLNEVDCRILEFSILLRNEWLLYTAAEVLGDMTHVKVHTALSVILDIPIKDVREALAFDSTLARTGLLAMNRNGAEDMRSKLEVLSDDFADLAISEVLDPIDLLRDQLFPAKPPELNIDDYTYIEQQLRVLRPYLIHASNTNKQGVNILLYGDPGTGKSQLVKVLAKLVGCELYEVASEESDGDAVNGSTRLQTYRAAQTFLINRKAMLVFEEIEDIFPERNIFSFLGSSTSRDKTSKAWINRILEENKVATFWVSNSVNGIDPAYTRRFDMVIEMPVPPRRKREQIISKCCEGLIDDKCIARLSESEQLAPAVITRVASVVKCIKDELKDESVSDCLEQMVNSTLRAQGHRTRINTGANQLPDYYDPAYINTELDLKALPKGLAISKSGRLCLYGPSGTGKTAYGRWLAKELDLPLTIKRASDLMAPYVGETEQNMARAFESATRDGAVIMIDEVDSFLQDRRNASQSWQVSVVNEFLTQMESFSGIFIASTNLMDGLDQAAMRRFDLKAKFDYLKETQAWQLYKKQCEAMSMEVNGKTLRSRLSKLDHLTPGDYAAVARTHRFRPLKDAGSVIDALIAECSYKEQHRPAIGFM